MATHQSHPPQDVALVVQRLRPATFSVAVVLIVGVVLVQAVAIGSIFWLRSVTANAKAVALALEKAPDQPLTPPTNGFVVPTDPNAVAGAPGAAPADPNAQTQPSQPMTLNSGGTDAGTPVAATPTPGAPVQVYEPETPNTSQPEANKLTSALEPGLTPPPASLPGGASAMPPGMEPPPSTANMSEAAAEMRRKIHSINSEGLRLKELGDVNGAEKNFHEALALDPKDANTLLKLAALYTENNRKEDAKLYWQKLVDLGATIGAPYLEAKEQLALLNPAPPKISIESSLQKKLFIDKVERVAANPTRPNNEFAMRIVVAANELESVDPGLVGIKLFFYDKLPDGRIAPSAAQLKVKWESGQQTWKNNARETLSANFTLNSPEGREYYGYVLRINYEGKLQDEKIEPGPLAELVAPAQQQPAAAQ
ncbi:MAG: tetratricopeptide repeat protein [Candidatus Methylacidiphilales bacterium]|nr:tetratricopeptide repeat protein [Candidatus Methylacidiphilales bacterium]